MILPGAYCTNENFDDSLKTEPVLYSYTKYDSLGRITEVGQVSNTGSNGAMTDAISRNQPFLENWLAALTSRRGQITNTVYDLPYTGFEGIADTRLIISQRNLRNRVSYTTLTDTGAGNVYNQATFYTYDILGNVDHLLQDYGNSGYTTTANVMNKNNNRWKKISYQYDLISGKVNMVMYQHDWMDGFFHRYSYDAENRLTLVETSRDSLVWEKDARYDYYRHGPLARVTLGEQQVQGIDYAYTLQGWLKGINSTGGTDSFDMGEDAHTGSLNQYVAKDALGLTLNYFGNDYTAINGTPFPGYSGFLSTDAYRPLYNGNISSSSVFQSKFDTNDFPGGPLIFYNYKYDQLNRLTGQDAFAGFNSASNSWSAIATMGENLKERIAYDANGNILKYLRKSISSTTTDMDSLNYHFYAGTNQLKQVTDNVPANGYNDPEGRIVDIDGQPDNNYGYDAIGNLIKDSAEKITSIKWNVYGKIQEITKNDAGAITTIKYTYDASGNRISQTVNSPSDDPVITWYVRDAQGNIMSTYTAKGNASDLEDLTLKQSEKYLYGSSRLGLITLDDPDVDGGGPSPMRYYYGVQGYERGDKEYELTNHLGNVLATISDRKFGVTSGSSSLISYYEPHIVTAQDYYPFGMLSRVSLPNSGKTYKFGFNGKMNDDEVKGMGNQQDYGFRIYDPRLGRFLSTDPLSKSYPWYTPYQFAGNKPIGAVDLDGAEPQEAIELWSQTKGFIDKGDVYKNGGTLLKVEGYNVFVREWSSSGKDYFWFNKNIKNPKWQQFEPNALEKRYENLGIIGNRINSYVDSHFEKATFENYWLKKGDYQLSDYRFGKIKEFITANQKIDFDAINKDPHSKVIFEDGSEGYKTVVSFYKGKGHEEYDQTFGSATVYLNQKGEVVGLYDVYDFDTRMLKNLTPGKTDRSIKAELQTDAVAGAAAATNSGKDFKITYGKQEKKPNNKKE